MQTIAIQDKYFEALKLFGETDEFVIVQVVLYKLLLPMDWQIHRIMAWICQSKPSSMQDHLNQYKKLMNWSKQLYGDSLWNKQQIE